MKRARLIFLLIGIATSLNAQQLNEIYPYDLNDEKSVIRSYGEAYHSSGDIPNSFSNYFIKGGYIDSTTKKNVLDQLKKNNRIGAEINFNIDYYNRASQFFGQSHWGWMFSVGQTENFNMSFSKQLFELAFFGNKNFAGDSVDLAPFDFQQVTFQKISVGAFNKRNYSSISLGLIKGQRFADIHANKALLYTEANGNQIDLSLNESVTRSDTSRNGFSAFNGWGLASDLVFYLNMGQNRNIKFKTPIKLSLQNFGFIQWNSNTMSQTKDSTYSYSGFEVQNLLSDFNSPFSSTTINDTLNFVSQKHTITKILPFTFTASKVVDPFSSAPIQAYYGMRLRAFSNYKPLIFAGIHVKASTAFSASLNASVGGYGSFRAGLQFAGRIKNHFQWSVNSSDLIGWLSTAKGYGRDLGLTLNAYF